MTTNILKLNTVKPWLHKLGFENQHQVEIIGNPYQDGNGNYVYTFKMKSYALYWLGIRVSKYKVL